MKFWRSSLACLVSVVCAASLLSFAAIANAASGSISGTIQVSHSDDLDSGHSQFLYSLITNSGRRYQLDVNGRDLPADETAPAVNGARATVRGSLRGGVLHEQSLQISPLAAKRAARARVSAAGVTRRIAVVNLQFSSKSKFSNAQLSKAAANLDGFISEAGGGGIDLAGVKDPHADVFGPYVVPKVNPLSPGNKCNFNYWADQAVAQAAADGIEIANPGANGDPLYDTVAFVFPHTSCGFGGIADLGGISFMPQTRLWLNGVQKAGLGVFAHELGHNLGAMHASQVTGSFFKEYGDPYDVMGRSRANEYNSFWKARMGTIGTMPAQSFSYVTQSGNYTLAPNDSSLGGTQALMIPRPVEGGTAGPWLALEIRHPFGVFNNKPGDADDGVSVRIVPRLDQTTYRNTMLLGKPYRPGSTFTDAASGVTVKVNSIDAGGNANVDITTASKMTQQTEPVGNLSAKLQPGGHTQLDWDTPGISRYDLGHWDYTIYSNGNLLNFTRYHSFLDQHGHFGPTDLHRLRARLLGQPESADQRPRPLGGRDRPRAVASAGQ